MKADPVRAISMRAHIKLPQLAKLMGLSFPGADDFELLSRAVTLDFRNVGTAGRETDSVLGDYWPEEVLQHPNAKMLQEVPRTYGADKLRSLLTRHDWPPRHPEDESTLAGKKIFTQRVVGRILNQRVVYGREARVPRSSRTGAALVPLDRSKSLTDTIEVSCASCHNHSPGRTLISMPSPLTEFQRCNLCHFDHPQRDSRNFIAIEEHMKAEGITEYESCISCHNEHPVFGPQVYSNSWLLPFDADGDGITQNDEIEDGKHFGIGTDANLNLDSLFVQQLTPPALRKHQETYLLSDNARKAPNSVSYSHEGFGFVRVAPLITLDQTAPYLHNGSVPTLIDLLKPNSARPASFPVGYPEQKFTFDTKLPGNRNVGHEFGIELSDKEKRDLVRFMESLP
ncbi:MAG: hypothetical protein IPK83_05975 [Planctomycetes bacterium]|nr:hypothetical protein [Planctomycetota bacterium]